MSDEKNTSSEDAAGEDMWAEAMAEQAAAGQATESDSESEAATPGAEPAGSTAPAGKPYSRAQFQALQADAAADDPDIGQDVNMEVILDIPVTISMEIGRTRIPIRNLLQLNQGSVVELDRLAGEPMDVLVNGTLIAHGEVVVVNEKFGIRLTDVISPAERVKKLQ